jgi:hypothetical protein
MPNLKLNTLAKALNMTADVKKQLVFGNYRGYSMYIKVSDYGYCFNYSINILLSPKNPDNMDNTIKALDTLRSENPTITKASYADNKLIITILSTDKKVNSYQFIFSVLNEVVEYANANELVKCCEKCGNYASFSNLEFVSTNNNSISFRCTSCKADTKPIVVEAKSNIPLGIIGALIGSIPGVIILLLTFPLEGIDTKILSLIGGLMVFGVFKGYDYFGRVLDTNGKMICFLLSLAISFLSQYFRALIALKVSEELTFSEIMDVIRFTPLIANELLVPCLIVYLISVIGSIYFLEKFD